MDISTFIPQDGIVKIKITENIKRKISHKTFRLTTKAWNLEQLVKCGTENCWQGNGHLYLLAAFFILAFHRII